LPQTKVVFYREDGDTVPVLDWLDTLPFKAQDKCRVRIERLQKLGHELRRPEGEYLRDGIYELRVGFHGNNYRILYFFHRQVAVLAHGVMKERVVASAEIDKALRRKMTFDKDLKGHTYQEVGI
jgi:phage-related protein